MIKHREPNRLGRILWIVSFMVVALAGSARAQAGGAGKAPAYLVTAMSTLDFSGTLETLKAAIEEQNLMVIAEIDPQKMLRMVGVKANGMRQLLFFHPRYMKRILEGNPVGGIEPPLKIMIMEKPDGGVVVRYMDPSIQFGQYAGLEDLGNELAGVIESIVASVEA